MGLIRMGPPQELIGQLQTKFSIGNFVETGTYYGETAIWAAHNFKQVFTIEYSEKLYQEVSNKYDDIKNIKFIFGDSRTELNNLINQLNSSSIFWLDAHWSGGITYGIIDQCPLLEEIKIINCSKFEDFVFIDDARLFTSPPQPPHQIEQWSDITTIIDSLKVKDRYIVIIEDVIIAVPSFAKPLVASYCQNINALAWQEYGKPNFRKGMELIGLDLKQRLGRFKQWFKKA